MPQADEDEIAMRREENTVEKALPLVPGKTAFAQLRLNLSGQGVKQFRGRPWHLNDEGNARRGDQGLVSLVVLGPRHSPANSQVRPAWWNREISVVKVDNFRQVVVLPKGFPSGPAIDEEGTTRM